MPANGMPGQILAGVSSCRGTSGMARESPLGAGGTGSLCSPSLHLAPSMSLHPYSFLSSIPLGRTTYKEQYLFIYR